MEPRIRHPYRVAFPLPVAFVSPLEAAVALLFPVEREFWLHILSFPILPVLFAPSLPFPSFFAFDLNISSLDEWVRNGFSNLRLGCGSDISFIIGINEISSLSENVTVLLRLGRALDSVVSLVGGVNAGGCAGGGALGRGGCPTFFWSNPS